MAPRFSEYLDAETKRQMNAISQTARQQVEKKPPRQLERRPLPVVIEPDAREQAHMEYERLMRGNAFRRGRDGAVRQTRHSE